MKKLTYITISIFITTNLIYSQDIINETGKDGKFIVRDAEQNEALVIENGNVNIIGELKVETMTEGKNTDDIVVWDKVTKSLKVVPRVFSMRSPLSTPLDAGKDPQAAIYDGFPIDRDEPLNPEDQVILDDLIVDGSICVGFDCVNGESFGFNTIILKENNLRIRFVDTSSSASFPSNDWQITINDASNGGQNKFSIDDIDGGRTPFTIEASAPSHSLYVDDGGRVGFGTSTPVVGLHSKDGNTPTLRLEQDGSSGFTPQTWDVAGNEAGFFIRDATNGSTLPFRIEPGAPSSAIHIKNNGFVGLGITDPSEHLNIKGSGEQNILVTSTDNLAGIWLNSNTTDNFWKIFNPKNSPDLRIATYHSTKDQINRVVIKKYGFIGMGIDSPSDHLHIYGGNKQRVNIASTNDLAGILINGNKPDNNWSIHNSQDSGDLRFFGTSGAYGNGTRMILKENGDIGIGTAVPQEKLHIEFDNGADILLGQGDSDPDNTFIALRSPNGTRYYITVDNFGALVTSTNKP